MINKINKNNYLLSESILSLKQLHHVSYVQKVE
jgi:hypothetical protein